ncbi:concanavalin A-like lectin/glucanase domain-containing protein, partial [Immersiella caudata]
MAALAYAARAAAGGSQCEPTTGYALEDEYIPSNFFDKFNFLEGPDPTQGYISYQSRSNAETLGLIKETENDVYIGIDYEKSWPALGRESVRIQSKDEYNSGLFIADFARFPKPLCGAWPAFWMYGPVWPNDGEIDIYEGWHDPGFNHITGHTNKHVAGDCKLRPQDSLGSTVSTDCHYEINWNQGCSVQESNGLWGSETGGVYAMEWTDEFIKVWSWAVAPADVQAGTPDPTTWGKAHYAVTDASCDIGKAFNNMKFVINIALCGDGPNSNWVSSGCAASTGKSECWHYAREEPAKFEEVHWKVRSIKVYQ